jgi:hypothetical protein
MDDPRVKSLGPGDAHGFSPDGKWALAYLPTEAQLKLYSTRTGDQVQLNRGTLEQLGAGEQTSWYPDSAAVLACGNEPGRPPRCYRIAVSGGRPEPVTPEGVGGGWAAPPDGRRILGRLTDGTCAVFSSPNGPPRAVPGLTAADSVFGWTADGRAVFGGRPGLPFRLEKIDVDTGRRTFFKELAPADRHGVGMIGLYYQVFVLPDGRGYAYNYTRSVSTLYTVDGASALLRER